MTGPLSGGDARTQLAEGAEVAAAWLFDFTMRRTNVAARWSDAEIGAGAISDGALRRAWHYEAERLLDALLPVVERIADERAAEALEQAAEMLRDHQARAIVRASGMNTESTTFAREVGRGSGYGSAAHRVSERAASLREGESA